MVKLPVAGRVKTRLARETGVATALRFYRHATHALLARVGRDPRWRTVLAVTPDAAIDGRAWPRDIARIAQGTGGLGARMQRLFAHRWLGPVIIVGTDIPGLAPRAIAAAFRALRSNDAVFGPALDGGYWLVGLRRSPRLLSIFDDVRWSSAHALADTLANLEGRRVAFASELSDVDCAEDWRRAAQLVGRRTLPTPENVHST